MHQSCSLIDWGAKQCSNALLTKKYGTFKMEKYLNASLYGSPQHQNGHLVSWEANERIVHHAGNDMNVSTVLRPAILDLFASAQLP